MAEKVELTLTVKDQQFLRSMAKAQTATDKNTRAFKGLGGAAISMNAALGLASSAARTLAGAMRSIGTAVLDATKAASDFAEANQKFEVVFGDVANAATEMREVLVDAYGFSERAATDLLASTGDLLTGFGLTGKQAIDLSGQVATLGADLASFTNFAGGTAGAVEAINKAMIGERESIKALGIVIREDAVQEELRRQGKEKLVGMALLQAKAEATLAIAIKQSKNAIGDVARTSEQYANQVRFLNADIEDLQILLGATFLDIGKKVIPILGGLVKETGAWAAANKDALNSFSVDAFKGIVTGIEFSVAAVGRLTQALLVLKLALNGVWIIAAAALNGIGQKLFSLIQIVNLVVIGIKKAFSEAFTALEIEFNEFVLGLATAVEQNALFQKLLPDSVVDNIGTKINEIADRIDVLKKKQEDIPSFSDMVAGDALTSDLALLTDGMGKMVVLANESAVATQSQIASISTGIEEVESLSEAFLMAAESARTIKIGGIEQEDDEAGSGFGFGSPEDAFASEEARQAAYLEALIEGAAARAEFLLEQQELEDAVQEERLAKFTESAIGAFGATGDTANDIFQTVGKTIGTVFGAVEKAISATFKAMIIGGKSAKDVMKDLAATIAGALIDALVRIGVQSLLNLFITKTTKSSEIQAAAGLAYANAFASTAAIPIIGPALAPGVATAAGAAASAGGMAFLGSKRVGSDSLSADGMAMLHQGERIVPSQTNVDLTEFLREMKREPSGGGGGGTSIVIEGDFIGSEENADRLVEMISESIELRNTDFRGSESESGF